MIRLAVLGARHIHLPDALQAIARRRDAEVVSVYDVSGGRGRHWATSAGARMAATADDALHDVDACLVYSEPSQHPGLVGIAGEHGRPAFIEKPLVLDPTSAQTVRRLAPPRCQLGFFLRHSHALRRLRELIHAGELGAVREASLTFVHNGLASGWFDGDCAWMRSAAEGGGGFFDLAPHCVDTAMWLFGRDLGAEMCVLTGGHHGIAGLTAGTVGITIEAGWEAPELRIEVVVTGGRRTAAARDGILEVDGEPVDVGSRPAATDALWPWLQRLRGGGGELASLDDGVANVEIMCRLRSLTGE